MNFQNLKSIEDYKFFIDVAFRRANEKASIIRRSKNLKGTKIEKSKKMELLKLDVIRETISTRLLGILKTFPSLEQLPEFYNELIKCTLDYPVLKKSLGALNWANKKVVEMHKKYLIKIKKCMDMNRINDYRRAFYGRISSIMKQIRDALKYLETARKIMKNYPAIKTGTKTIAIAGFPNVGKTTLLMKLTGSKPDIQPYAFTTKGINVGSIKGKQKLQLLDTPGTLNRFDKMNNIEKVAFLALKLLAEKIIYVFDLSEPYPLEKQVELYKRIKAMEKPVIVYLSKTDILDKKTTEDFSKKYNASSLGQIMKSLP